MRTTLTIKPIGSRRYGGFGPIKVFVPVRKWSARAPLSLTLAASLVTLTTPRSAEAKARQLPVAAALRLSRTRLGKALLWSNNATSERRQPDPELDQLLHHAMRNGHALLPSEFSGLLGKAQTRYQQALDQVEDWIGTQIFSGDRDHPGIAKYEDPLRRSALLAALSYATAHSAAHRQAGRDGGGALAQILRQPAKPSYQITHAALEKRAQAGADSLMFTGGLPQPDKLPKAVFERLVGALAGLSPAAYQMLVVLGRHNERPQNLKTVAENLLLRPEQLKSLVQELTNAALANQTITHVTVPQQVWQAVRQSEFDRVIKNTEAADAPSILTD